jgi:hypothetical protein
MASADQPLLTLSPARIQDELRRAAAAEAAFAASRRHTRRLALICIGDCLAGMALIALSASMTNGDLAAVVFYWGLLRAVGVPVWTVLLSIWLEANG